MTTEMKTKLVADEFDVCLFDIDGTLLRCDDAVHYFAFCNALTEMAGRPLNLDGVTAHGNTDVGILRDAFALAQVPESEWRGRLNELCDSMCRFVEAHEHEMCVAALPSAPEFLQQLRENGAILGVATGNLENIGKKKLKAAGLLDYFHFGGWSDGLEYRRDVFRRAVGQAREIVGASARILVVGDTPADIRAAHDNGLPCLAVATGVYSFEQLEEEKPDFCIHSLAELAVTV